MAVFRVAVNTYVPIFWGLDARGGRKLTNTHTHGTTTVTIIKIIQCNEAHTYIIILYLRKTAHH